MQLVWAPASSLRPHEEESGQDTVLMDNPAHLYCIGGLICSVLTDDGLFSAADIHTSTHVPVWAGLLDVFMTRACSLRSCSISDLRCRQER